MIKVTVNGKTYPAYQTMLAYVLFKRETGHEASEIPPTAVSETAIFLWCCVKAACKREETSFDVSFDDFAAWIDLNTLQEWAKAVNGGESENDGEKKS